MLMKVFPHGTGEGDKPSRYLVRPDYPGRDTAPPHVLRGDPAMTRALIDSIERRWKFTSGVLSWHPDEKISEAQEEEVIDAFECVAFAGLDVVSTEPIRADNPLLKAKNCIITPHMSWGSQGSRQRIMDCTVNNIRAFLSGTPKNVVNP